MSDRAVTYDEGKDPLAELPWAAIRSLSCVQLYGHKKYKDFNNYRKGMEVKRNLSCALRHIVDYLEGSDQDHESGLHPLAHAFARVSFVLQNIHDGTAIDDRFRLNPPPDRLAAMEQALEDVCCGTKLDCPRCGKKLPCLCEHGKASP